MCLTGRLIILIGGEEARDSGAAGRYRKHALADSRATEAVRTSQNIIVTARLNDYHDGNN